MKKLFAYTALIVLFIPLLNAQENTFRLGDKALNLGIGIGSFYGTGINSSTTIPPVSISFEKGIKDEVLEKGVIGLGAYFGYTSYKWHYVLGSVDYGWKYSNIVIGARGNFHYPLLDNLDTYAGVLLGYNIVNSSSFGTSGAYDYSPDSGSLVFSGYVGGRYFFSDKLCGFAELGYGIAYLTLGLSIVL